MNRMRHFAVAIICICSACGPTAEENNPPGGGTVTEVTDYITEDTVWEEGTYIMPEGDYRVQARLTIEPCSVIQLGSRTFVGDGGAIVAIGTEDCPIVFTSRNATPAAGDNRGIFIEGSADNGNEFEHVIFEYTGTDTGAVNLAAGAKFRNTTVRHTPEIGMTLFTGDLLEFSNVTFEDIGGFPFNVDYNDVSVIDGVTTTDVEENKINVLGPALEQDDTWDPESIPYQINGDARITAALTIEAGTLLQITAANRFFVEEGGSITANGTADDPVIFESANDTKLAGDWRTFWFTDGSSASSLTHTVVRHGGGDGSPVFTTDAPMTFDNVTFEENEGCEIANAENVTATESMFEACE